MTTEAPSIVWEILNRNLFFVRSAVKRGEFKTSDKYDICDPETGNVLLESREPQIGKLTKALRFIGGDYDMHAAFDFQATAPGDGQQILRIRYPGKRLFQRPPTEFLDHSDVKILTLKKRNWTLGHKFQVTGPNGEKLFELAVKSMFNGYRFLVAGQEIAKISLRWKGEHAAAYKSGKYKFALVIHESVAPEKIIRQLLLAVSLAFSRVMGKKPRW